VVFPSRVGRVFHIKSHVSLRFDLFYFSSFSPSFITQKTGNSCIKIHQLGRGDNDNQSPHMKEQNWPKLGLEGARSAGRAMPTGPLPSGAGSLHTFLRC
jgi:hypothetical protein